MGFDLERFDKVNSRLPGLLPDDWRDKYYHLDENGDPTELLLNMFKDAVRDTVSETKPSFINSNEVISNLLILIEESIREELTILWIDEDGIFDEDGWFEEQISFEMSSNYKWWNNYPECTEIIDDLFDRFGISGYPGEDDDIYEDWSYPEGTRYFNPAQDDLCIELYFYTEGINSEE